MDNHKDDIEKSLENLKSDLKKFFTSVIQEILQQIINNTNKFKTLKDLNSFMVGEKKVFENQKQYSWNIIGILKTLLNDEYDSKKEQEQKFNDNLKIERLDCLLKKNTNLFDEIKTKIKSLAKSDNTSLSELYNLYITKYIINSKDNNFNNLEKTYRILLENYLLAIEHSSIPLSENYIKLFDMKLQDVPSYVFEMNRFYNDDKFSKVSKTEELQKKRFDNIKKKNEKSNETLTTFILRKFFPNIWRKIENKNLNKDGNKIINLSESKNLSFTVKGKENDFRITYFSKDKDSKNFPNWFLSRYDDSPYKDVYEIGPAIGKYGKFYYIGNQEDKEFKGDYYKIDTIGGKIYHYKNNELKDEIKLKKYDFETFEKKIKEVVDEIQEKSNSKGITYEKITSLFYIKIEQLRSFLRVNGKVVEYKSPEFVKYNDSFRKIETINGKMYALEFTKSSFYDYKTHEIKFGLCDRYGEITEELVNFYYTNGKMLKCYIDSGDSKDYLKVLNSSRYKELAKAIFLPLVKNKKEDCQNFKFIEEFKEECKSEFKKECKLGFKSPKDIEKLKLIDEHNLLKKDSAFAVFLERMRQRYVSKEKQSDKTAYEKEIEEKEKDLLEIKKKIKKGENKCFSGGVSKYGNYIGINQQYIDYGDVDYEYDEIPKIKLKSESLYNYFKHDDNKWFFFKKNTKGDERFLDKHLFIEEKKRYYIYNDKYNNKWIHNGTYATMIFKEKDFYNTDFCIYKDESDGYKIKNNNDVYHIDDKNLKIFYTTADGSELMHMDKDEVLKYINQIKKIKSSFEEMLKSDKYKYNRNIRDIEEKLDKEMNNIFKDLNKYKKSTNNILFEPIKNQNNILKSNFNINNNQQNKNNSNNNQYEIESKTGNIHKIIEEGNNYFKLTNFNRKDQYNKSSPDWIISKCFSNKCEFGFAIAEKDNCLYIGNQEDKSFKDNYYQIDIKNYRVYSVTKTKYNHSREEIYIDPHIFGYCVNKIYELKRKYCDEYFTTDYYKGKYKKIIDNFEKDVDQIMGKLNEQKILSQNKININISGINNKLSNNANLDSNNNNQILLPKIKLSSIMLKNNKFNGINNSNDKKSLKETLFNNKFGKKKLEPIGKHTNNIIKEMSISKENKVNYDMGNNM